MEESKSKSEGVKSGPRAAVLEPTTQVIKTLVALLPLVSWLQEHGVLQAGSRYARVYLDAWR
jgi:hypothetical protein